jgi:hypothetical protein
MRGERSMTRNGLEKTWIRAQKFDAVLQPQLWMVHDGFRGQLTIKANNPNGVESRLTQPKLEKSPKNQMSGLRRTYQT